MVVSLFDLYNKKRHFFFFKEREKSLSAFTVARKRNALQENSIDSRAMEDVVEIVPLRVIYGSAVARSAP